jgi:hypothetical protein
MTIRRDRNAGINSVLYKYSGKMVTGIENGTVLSLVSLARSFEELLE